jgi:putative heme-binding domain-containing protein
VELDENVNYGGGLLEAVRDAKVPSGAVPKDVADRLRSSMDTTVAGLAGRLFPATPTLTGDARRRVEDIGAVLRRAPGDPYAGEATFLERCAGCHKLFFKGGSVGPDLTPYQRDNLATLLPSIVDPDAEIREGFQCYTVETKDGRTLSGFFVDRDNQVTVLRGLDGENVTLRAADIAEMRPLGRSLMPSGLLDGLADQQLRDLFAYLRISQPITR